MTPVTRNMVAACLVGTVIAAGVGIVMGGQVAGTVVSNGSNLTVRVDEKSPKKTISKNWQFAYGVDTEASLGGETIRATDIGKQWEISVTYESKDEAKAAIIRGPLTATKITVNTTKMAATYLGNDGTAKMKISYTETVAPKPGSKAKPAIYVRRMALPVFDRAKFVVDGQEVDRSSLGNQEGQECEAELIDVGAGLPIVAKLTFKSAVDKTKK